METSVFVERRKKLIEKIKTSHSQKDGIVVLIADFEQERQRFRQESSFYYLTGITEPGVCVTIELDGTTTAYIPETPHRSLWMNCDNKSLWDVNRITKLGDEVHGYSISPFSALESFKELTNIITSLVKTGKTIFTLNPGAPSYYILQKLVLLRLCKAFPELEHALVDIFPLVADMRRTKSKLELQEIYLAEQITMAVHMTIASMCEQEVRERELEAAITSFFSESDATPAFPSIVASGPNSVVLHHGDHTRKLQTGDLVVVDIGAEYHYYCADLTRTYPVNGTFTERQLEVYKVVHDTLKYVRNFAKPGYWLHNKNNPDKSLHHLALKFLEEKGYGEYMPHSIGHFLGLDVHDVGDYAEPLRVGDVITLEPGIYIPQENIGIRLEDNFWIIDNEAICLSEELPRNSDDIEMLAQAQDDDDEEDEFLDDEDESSLESSLM